ncbi:MAG TPA: TetR family transcriptional regulator C-terminal domain-containing protein [Parvibaculum sp.]
MQDITAAAGVPKGSFYNHFESKEALGIEALNAYWRVGLGWLDILNSSDAPPLSLLKTYFRRAAKAIKDENYRTGCMVGNFAIEMSGASDLIRAQTASVLSVWSRAIEDCVKRAQADGSMRRDLDAKTIARFLLNSWQGAAMRAKVDRNYAAFTDFETVAFKALSA